MTSKSKVTVTLSTLFGVALLIGVVNACDPIRSFHKVDRYTKDLSLTFDFKRDVSKALAIIIADNSGTEIFDLLAPFHIFSSSGLYQVIIAGTEPSTIPLWKGMHLVPSLTFEDLATMNIKPDLVLIPAVFMPENKAIQSWLKNTHTESVLYLSVCEGARVIAESKLFEDKKVTTHHSSLSSIKKKYPNQDWVDGYKFVSSGNLYSTSGVSAATEGAIKTIERINGVPAAREAMRIIHYPGDSIDLTLAATQVKFTDMLKIGLKTAFSKNKNILIYLPQRFNEFKTAALIDAYNRSFPKSIFTFSLDDSIIVSQFGLNVFPTQKFSSILDVDEIIIPLAESDLNEIEKRMVHQLREKYNCGVKYYSDKEFVFKLIYRELTTDYGKRFSETVFRLLDAEIDNMP